MSAAKTSTPNFGQSTRPFVLSGIPPLALIPVTPPGAKIAPTAQLEPKHLGKAPGSYHPKTGEWSGLYGSVIHTGLDAERRERAASWPTGNVGLLGRAYPGIDSDAETKEVRWLVEEAVAEEFNLAYVAERIRGKNHRRLYVVRARDPKNNPVRTRHVRLRLPGEEPWSKIDIIGKGGQYLVAGTHPSGDLYTWAEGADLTDPEVHRNLLLVDEEDISRLLDRIEDRVRKLGGEFDGGGAGAIGLYDERDPLNMAPTYDLDTIQRIFDSLPNDEDNFPTLDSFVSFLAAIRAAAGRNCDDPDLEDAAREWATAQGWADDAYFDKRWQSLRYVRATGNSLDRICRERKIFVQSAAAFERDEEAQSATIEKHKRAADKERKDALRSVAGRFIFRDTNTAINGHATLGMRDPFDADKEWPGVDWWLNETTRSTRDLSELHAEFGPKRDGFWEFARALKREHPMSWFVGEAKNPFHDFGEIFQEQPEPGVRGDNRLNTWHMSQTIRIAGHADKNPARSADDVKFLLDFGARLFGEKLWRYELQTLAYMVQKNARPNGFLVLVGDQGVGKSMYMQMLVTIFNGKRKEQSGTIDGTKLVGDGARFALADIEGCRIVSIKEMPKGGGGRQHRSNVTAMLKQLADNGADGDFITIERKGENAQQIPNYARVVISTNYPDSIEVEGQARRVFMVESGITVANRPDDDFYAKLDAITTDPERMAAFYRFLQTLDISEYKSHANPPSSRIKTERMLANVKDATERHARAAVAWFEHAGIDMFMPNDLFDAMEKCALAEFENSGRQDDHRREYRKDFGGKGVNTEFAVAIRKMGGVVTRSKYRISSNGRGGKLPAPYFVKSAERAMIEFEMMKTREAMTYLETQEEIPLGQHPFELYRLSEAT